MRIDSSGFDLKNTSTISDPVLVIECSVTHDNSEVFYMTSHEVDGLPVGPEIFTGIIKTCSATTQRLNLENFSSSIGNIKASVIDAGQANGNVALNPGGLSDYLRLKDIEDKTTSNHRFSLYAGFKGIDFSEFSLVQTQIVNDIEYNDGLVVFNCLDVQRQVKKKIFDLKKTILAENINIGDSVINVQSTNLFETVWHGPSYNDSPNTDVGYLIIRKGDNHEILRWTSKTATSFTVERGAFGTVEQDWKAIKDDGSSANLKVEEFVYLELPIAKLIYALLTGNLYGDTGKRLPDHWNLDIDEQYIDTTSFLNVGGDIWNPDDDTHGIISYLKGIGQKDGKSFIQKELLPMISCFMPISVTGELRLQAITTPYPKSPAMAFVDSTSIKKISSIKYGQDKVKNKLLIDWDYDYLNKNYKRSDIFIDQPSIDKYGERDFLKLQLGAMHGSRHSRDTIKKTFAMYRLQFAENPIYCRIDVSPGLNIMEVGDTIRLNLDNWPDYTDVGDLNRTMQVQGVTVDWLKHNVSLDLFGATHDGSPILDDGDGYDPSTSLSDLLLTSIGSNIETSFSGNVSRSGDLVTLDSDITFNGNEILSNNGVLNSTCVLYCDGDFTIPFGVTLNITQNVVLIATGNITINGRINGVGAGANGCDWQIAAMDQHYDARKGGVIYINYDEQNYSAAKGGYLSTFTRPQRGWLLYQNAGFLTYKASGARHYAQNLAGVTASILDSKINSVPEFEINRNNLNGLPKTLVGTGGPAGHHIFEWTPTTSNDIPIPFRANGTSGGNGGAGLVTISRGFSFGVSGEIDLSGGDAGLGSGTYTHAGETFRGGRGAGGSPGCWACLIDGVNTSPIPDANNFKANYGDGSSVEGNILEEGNIVIGTEDPTTVYKFAWGPQSPNGVISLPGDDHVNVNVSSYNVDESENQYQAHSNVQFLLNASDAPGEELPDYEMALDVTNIQLSLDENNPQTPDGDRTSIEVTVTPPVGDDSYSHAIIYYRKTTDTAWTMVDVAAETETVFDVLADGAEYIVQARSVNKDFVENDNGPTSNIIVNTITNSTDRALEIGYNPTDDNFIRFKDTLSDSDVVVLSKGSGISGLLSAGPGSEGYQNLSDRPTVFTQEAQPVAQNIDDVWIQPSTANVHRWNGSVWYLYANNEQVFRQASAPSTGMSIGDLWIDTDDGNRIYYYNGSVWQDSRDEGIVQAINDSANAIAIADGKIESFWQNSAPTTGMSEGDIWFDTNDGNRQYRYDGSVWQDAQDDLIATAISDAATAQSTADGKMVVFTTGPSAPTPDGIGDLWIYDGVVRTWNGATWTLGADVTSNNTSNDTSNVNGTPSSTVISNINTALSDAANAQSTADGKITTFYQDTPPSGQGQSEGDIWFDTDDGNRIYIYESSSWVNRQDSDIATAISNAANAQSTADGKVTTFYSTSTPTPEGDGDLWYNTDTQVVQRWNGATWELISNLLDADFWDSSDLVFNSNHKLMSPDGTPAGVVSFGTTTSNIIEFLSFANGEIRLNTSNNNHGFLYRAFKLEENTKYKILISARSSSASSVFNVGMYETSNALLDDGTQHIKTPAYSGESGYSFTDSDSYASLETSGSLTTSYQEFEYEYTPTAGAKWASLAIRKGSSTVLFDLKIVSVLPIINSSADNTQDSVDTGITTTGGLVLSTNGSVRTSGKTNINDGNPGAFLGNNGSNDVFEIGDGDQKSMTFDGSDLVLGKGTKIKGYTSVINGDYNLQVNRFDSVNSSSSSDANITTPIDSSGMASIIFSNSAVSGSKASFNYAYPDHSLIYTDWFKNITFNSKLLINDTDDELIIFVGVGNWSNDPTDLYMRHIGFVIRNGDIYFSIRNGGSNQVTETYMRPLPTVLFPTILSFYADYDSKTIQFYYNGSLDATSVNDANYPFGFTGPFTPNVFLISAEASVDITAQRAIEFSSFEYMIEG